MKLIDLGCVCSVEEKITSEKNFWERGRGRKRKRLERILDACTKEDVSERIPGMREVMAMLEQEGSFKMAPGFGKRRG